MIDPGRLAQTNQGKGPADGVVLNRPAEKCQRVYQHVYDAYAQAGKSVYTAA